MENRETLNLFGKLLIEDVFDNHMSFTKHDLDDLKQTERFKNLFGNMTPIQKQEIENLSSELLSGMLFDFLRFFEENEDFKIIYESEGKQFDLVEISENLKAEPIIEGGWIDRFSKIKGSKDI